MKRTILLIFLTVACARPESPAPPPKPAAPPPIGDAARGKQLAKQLGCNVCHVIPGIEGAQGSIGPSLAGVGARPKISEEKVVNTPENLAKYIVDPAAMNPDSAMPPLGISIADAKDLAAFMLTLK